MKKAFTMIELIFVIVILGVLVAIALPRINATRDDAEFAKISINISTIITDFASYYTSKGELLSDVNLMTNVALDNNGNLKIKGKNCLNFSTPSTKEIKIKALNEDNENICNKFLELPTTKALLSSQGKTITKGDFIIMNFSESNIVW